MACKECEKLKNKIAMLKWELKRRDGWWSCEACGRQFGPGVERFDGGEVNLCAACYRATRSNP